MSARLTSTDPVVGADRRRGGERTARLRFRRGLRRGSGRAPAGRGAAWRGSTHRQRATGRHVVILTLDVGNSQIFGGVFHDQLVLRFRKPSRPSQSSDELGLFLRSVLRENGGDPSADRADRRLFGRSGGDLFAAELLPQVFRPRSVHPAGGRQDRTADPLPQSARSGSRSDRQCHWGDASVSGSPCDHHRPRHGDDVRRGARRSRLSRRNHSAGTANRDGSAGEEHGAPADGRDRFAHRTGWPIDDRVHSVRTVLWQPGGDQGVDA